MKGKAILKIAFVAGIGVLSNAALADTIIQKWSGEFLIVSNAEAKRIFDLNLTGFLELPALANRPTVITPPRKRGLTLSGTKTHVKQRFLPLTPLLMVSDVLWSPVLPA
ncbi:hypothetical protein, partial [Yersinia enterocolitica]|uniref:hypothetical protein n=1 Tax=Yersinia enterocolitica TaxID=630 RepID=UPI003D044FA0